MYSKVINPEKDGKIAFKNKGSVARLGNYLEKELDLGKIPDGKVFLTMKVVLRKMKWSKVLIRMSKV